MSAASRSGSKGLMSTPATGSDASCACSADMALAVRSRTGIAQVADPLASRRAVSSPSIPGIITSRITASGCSCAARTSA